MTVDILRIIADHARERVVADQARVDLTTMAARAHQVAGACQDAGADGSAFETALRAPGVSCICEVKKASPSKGVIEADFDPYGIARQYEAAGADAMSVLTEPKWFLGSDAYLEGISEVAGIPCLRKDFVVDAYQVYQARVLGASAVLLIASLLNDGQLREYASIAESLGMGALVETHDASEIARALALGARIIGVNNRDLRTFGVDVGHSLELRKLVPDDVVFVAESGIRGPEDVRALAGCQVDAVLVGEACMRAADKASFIASLKEAGR